MKRCFQNRRFGVRRRRDGWLLGVCRGLAGQLRLPAWVIRAFAVALLVTLGWPVLVVYIACGLLLPLESADGGGNGAGEGPLTRSARRLARRAGDLDARIARMESHVSSREFDFDRRLRATGNGSRR